ncbi:signal peptidase I [Salinadaptatus halalkaliphilus]|uniref:Signal peptidase I n=1 Tax=Salinadaptatus halalkaliphilus TaxID=2419781 RepID=A0A4S3TRJ2_9EURY|nr:signal peptidase I [Salinadaptatus halalkaliphilus]THE65218.1 signal peptidase I [Salinadaptatus halalkaliphilus]
MTARTYLERGLGIAVVIVIVLLLIGQVLGQPILLGYVATGSMEPTMNAGDGFVAIPSVVAGEIQEGDVVVYDARELHDGGLTTHRVVGETEDGYVTAGDANPFTDQDGDEPPVSESQIVATAWQVNGEVVTIPHLGTVVMGMHGLLEQASQTVTSALGIEGSSGSDGLGAFFVAIGVALLGFGLLLERFGPSERITDRSRRRKNVVRFWVAIGVVLVALVTVATAAMVIPAGTTEYGLVSSDSPTDDPQIVAPGETTTLTRTVDNAGFVPVVVVHEAPHEHVSVDPDRQTVGIRSEAETTVSLTAPEETGEYTRHVEEHRYLAVVSPSILGTLHDVHPLVAIAFVNVVVVAVTVALVSLLFGTGDFRLRNGGDHVPFSTRLARTVRKWLR